MVLDNICNKVKSIVGSIQNKCVSCNKCCCLHTSNHDIVATLIWKRKLNPNLHTNKHVDKNANYIFKLDLSKSTYCCLRSKTYVENSEEYVFYYGHGAIGYVWQNEKNVALDLNTVKVRDYLRRDLARLCGLNTIIITYVDENTILEHVTSIPIQNISSNIHIV